MSLVIGVRTHCRAERLDAQLADGTEPLSSAVVDPAPAIAWFAGPAVRRLAKRLRVAVHPDPRGVALALRLVEDGGSPLYVGPTVNDVRAAVAQIEHAL